MEFFDSHAHYNDEKFDDDRIELLKRLYNQDKITRIVCAGYNLEKSRIAVDLAQKYSFLYSTVGISPNDLDDFYIDSLERYKLAKRGFIFNITKKFSCLLKDILY